MRDKKFPPIVPGMSFGKLTVIRKVIHGNNKYKTHFECYCECGNLTVNFSYSLLSGRSASCGCSRRGEKMAGRKTHGMRYSPEYGAWRNMKRRCYEPNDKHYEDYHGRGVYVCDEWLNSFENFYKDMGKMPDKHTLERMDNNGPYCPKNCRWASRKEQANNRRSNRYLTYNGETKTVTQWSEIVGISTGVLFYRMWSGWPISKILTTPVRRCLRRV